MNVEQLTNVITEVIKTIDCLKAVKVVEGYVELSSNITFKGEETGNTFIVTVKIDEEDKITVDGDVSVIDIIKDVVDKYYE